MISPEQLALLLGSTLSTGAQYVPVTEVLTVASGTSLTLSATPYRTDLTTYPMSLYTNSGNDGSTIGTEITYAATPTTGQYSISGAVITFGESQTNQTFIITYYKASSANNKRVTVTSDQFPSTFKLTGYTLWKDQATGQSYPCRITVPKGKLLAPFTIKQESAGEPSTFTMKFTVLKDGDSSTMMIYDIETDTPVD